MSKRSHFMIISNQFQKDNSWNLYTFSTPEKHILSISTSPLWGKKGSDSSPPSLDDGKYWKKTSGSLYLNSPCRVILRRGFRLLKFHTSFHFPWLLADDKHKNERMATQAWKQQQSQVVSFRQGRTLVRQLFHFFQKLSFSFGEFLEHKRTP